MQGCLQRRCPAVETAVSWLVQLAQQEFPVSQVVQLRQQQFPGSLVVLVAQQECRPVQVIR